MQDNNVSRKNVDQLGISDFNTLFKSELTCPLVSEILGSSYPVPLFCSCPSCICLPCSAAQGFPLDLVLYPFWWFLCMLSPALASMLITSHL